MKWINIDLFEEDELLMAGGENLEKQKGHILDEFELLMGMVADFLDIEKQEFQNKSYKKIDKFFSYIIENRNNEDFPKGLNSIKEKFHSLRRIRNDASHGFFYYDYKGNLYLVNKDYCLLIEDSFEEDFREVYNECSEFLSQMQNELGHYEDII